MYINIGWGVTWGALAFGLLVVSVFKRRGTGMALAGVAAAALTILFGGIIAMHFAEKVGVSNPWWGFPPAVKATVPDTGRVSQRPTRAIIPPKHVHLVCDIRQSSSYAIDGNDCVTHHMYSGDTITLEVGGLTPRVMKKLCRQKYRSRWATSRGSNADGSLAPSMCPVTVYADNLGTDNELMADFANPGELGPDVVTWRLISRSGRVILSAKYTFYVLETDFQPLATPPS